MAELIRDRYEPLRVVGAGGQSTVLQALDHRRDRLVALKIRPRGSPDDEGSLLSEARILLGLEPHPLLCRVREDFFADDRYILVMDWVAGATLADLLAGTGGNGLPLRDVVHYLAQVAEALDYLHRHRPPVVHGDVKPANVIVTPEGKAVLVDFGISHQHAADTTHPTLAPAGTAGYAAPEVAAGNRPRPAADVFSLAATAFALLTGRPPQPGARPAWTGIDAERAGLVEFALRRGLAVDPARRPATASALVEALQGQLRTPNNLRVDATPFVGRTAEVAEVKALLATTRMLTLTGANGIGKSRLAVQVVADQLADYPDGAFLVDVAALADPADLPALARHALGTPDLVAHLERRNVVLLLDGCDPALAACAELAGTLLAASPHVRIVATAAQPLGAPGEVVYAVAPLSAPDPFRLPALDQLGGFDAVRLFVERAADASPGFDIRAADAPGLAQLCRRLDAIPLALELAAALTADRTLADLALDVADRFPLLDGGRRAPAKHAATVGAVLDWTVHLAPPEEQALLHRLSVFAGSFTTRAAIAVCGPSAEALLDDLARRALVGAEGARWRLHDTVRRYGAAQLVASSRDDDARLRYLEWTETLAGEARDAEASNVLAASAWARRRGR